MIGFRNENIRSIMSVLLAFILCLCIFFLNVFLSCALTLFNQNFIISAINKSQFYEGAKKAIEEDFISLAIPAGIPEEIIYDILDENTVYNNITQNYISLFDNKYKSYDDNEMKSLISMNVREYAIQKGVGGVEFEKELPELVGYFMDIYNKHINIPFISYYRSFRNTFNSISIWFIVITIIITITIITFFYNLYIHKKKILRYLYYSFSGASIMTIIPSLIFYNIELSHRINISPKYVYNLISEVLEQGISIIFYSGLFLLVISIIILIASIIAEHKIKQRFKR
ncbi:MAG: hypothetical protein K0S55_1263 [Clostridia bacterium]|nr:hypothetical protein [Clostridia bacterium]